METCTKIDNCKQVENKRIESSVLFKKYNENNSKLDSLSNKPHLVERNPTKNSPRDTYSIGNSKEIHSKEKYSDSVLGSFTNHFLLPDGAQYLSCPTSTTPLTSSTAAATTNTYLAHLQEGAKKYASVDRPALWAPIFWSILPYLLSRCFGYSDFWIELAHLLISLFWLYLSIKLPWDLYDFIMTSTSTPLAIRYSRPLVIFMIFGSPVMMLYLLDYFELQSSLTAATTSMKIVNPQVFLVITLFNPIRYFFWHGTSGRNCRPSYLNPGTLSQDTFALKRITTDERTVSLLEQKIRRLERSIENVVQLHKAFSTDEQTFRGQVQTSLLQLENKIHQKNRTGEEKSVNFSLSLIRTIIRILFLPWTLPFSYLKGKFRFNGC